MESSALNLNSVFMSHYRNLVEYCRRRATGGWADPEEIVHLAYLKCCRSWSAGHRSQVNEAAFFYRAIRWTIADVSRAGARRARHESASSRCQTQTHDPELAAREAVSLLPGRQRLVCEAVLAGKSRQQICAEFEMTPVALAVHLHRAKTRLMRLLFS